MSPLARVALLTDPDVALAGTIPDEYTVHELAIPDPPYAGFANYEQLPDQGPEDFRCGGILRPLPGTDAIFPMAQLTPDRVLPEPRPVPDPEPVAVFTSEGPVPITSRTVLSVDGQPIGRVQSVEFNPRRYMVMPERFEGFTEANPTLPMATISAQTVITGDLVANPTIDLGAVRQIAETQMLQRMQRQFGTIYNQHIGQAINDVTVNGIRNALIEAGGTQAYYTPITTNGVTITYDAIGTNNHVLIPGMNITNIHQEMDESGNLRIMVTAVVDNLTINNYSDYRPMQLSIPDVIRSKIRSNVLIKIKKDEARKPVEVEAKATAQELKARETLREMILESEYRRYITNGFIMVKGQSGVWYQIFNPRFGKPRSYKDGKPFETICIHTDNECPPTDHVINCKVMVEIDEETFRKGSNISKVWVPGVMDLQLREQAKQKLAELGEERLIDMWKRLKTA